MTRFGYFLSSEELSPHHLLAAAQAAEAAGFDLAWLSDHYHPWTSEQGESPFVWTMLGAILASTGLSVTTAVTCPTFRISPAVIAQAAATTAALAPGRFRLGLGSGEALNEHVTGEAWPPVSVRLERLEEAVDLLRRLLRGDTVTSTGGHFTVHNARLFTLPATPPEILISGFGPKATELAGRIADGWITTMPDEDNLARFRAANPRGVTQAGAKICWAPTEAEAVDTAHRLWGHQAAGGQISQDLPMWQGFEAIRDASPAQATAEAVPCGPDARKAAAALQPYLDAGFDELYIAQMGPDQEGGIRFLAEEVLPLLG